MSPKYVCRVLYDTKSGHEKRISLLFLSVEADRLSSGVEFLIPTPFVLVMFLDPFLETDQLSCFGQKFRRKPDGRFSETAIFNGRECAYVRK